VNHKDKILASVTARCGPDDLLLVPGDISWATSIATMKEDLEFLERLPCTLILSKGNHDDWASKKSGLRDLPKNCHWAEGRLFERGNVAIVATRLWDFDGAFPWPGHHRVDCPNPEKIANRELGRLETVLKLLPQKETITRILMVHFPPLAHDAASGILTDLISRYNVNTCIYGHVHGDEQQDIPAMDAVVGKTRYILTSCDHLLMTPVEIATFESDADDKM
jgi:predicted phosphohydrolase